MPSRTRTTAISTPSKRVKRSATALGKKKGPWTPKPAPGLVKIPGRAIPLRLRNTMRYSDTISIGLTAGVGQTTFSCNGLYDPWISAGHQPLYFDQLIALYNHYTVLWSKITVTPVVSSVSLVCNVAIDDNTGYNGPNVMLEQPEANYKVFGPVSAGGSQLGGVTCTWNQAKYFGTGSLQGAQLSGDAGANPTEQSQYVVTAYDPGSSSVTILLQVVMEFLVDWTETKTTAGS